MVDDSRASGEAVRAHEGGRDARRHVEVWISTRPAAAERSNSSSMGLPELRREMVVLLFRPCGGADPGAPALAGLQPALI